MCSRRRFRISQRESLLIAGVHGPEGACIRRLVVPIRCVLCSVPLETLCTALCVVCVIHTMPPMPFFLKVSSHNELRLSVSNFFSCLSQECYQKKQSRLCILHSTSGWMQGPGGCKRKLRAEHGAADKSTVVLFIACSSLLTANSRPLGVPPHKDC